MPPKAVPKTATGVSDGKQPTAQEAYLFYTIIKNMKGKPEIDWAAVAADTGYKTAETAKVRYGQIKRKLGLDNWSAGKDKDSKDEEAADDDAKAKTPAATRTRRNTTTPGTGAGIKKRTSAIKRTPGSRSRKAKPEAMIKIEDDVNQGTLDDDEDELVSMDQEVPETPTKKKARGRVAAKANKLKHNNNEFMMGILDEFANFPNILPESVIEREAILVNNNGVWNLCPVPIDVHAQWLARLPASLQTRFYTQAHSTTSITDAAATTIITPAAHKSSQGNGNGNSNTFDPDFILSEVTEEDERVAKGKSNAAETEQQLASGILGMMPMGLSGGYVTLSYNNDNNNNNTGGTRNDANISVVNPHDVNLHSIPWHPNFFAEQIERREEERDRAMLFGRGRGSGGSDGSAGHDDDEDNEQMVY
ncbi:hypothetical protein P885DRAFT_81165 [Corynascus similis CBS 632.67]